MRYIAAVVLCLPAVPAAQDLLPDARKSPVPVDTFLAVRIDVADIDRDGVLDAWRQLQLNSYGDGRSLWRGIADGRFAAVDSPLRPAALADLDGDGDLDVCEYGDIHEQTSPWVFRRRNHVEGGVWDTADIDADGLPDLITDRQVLRNDGSFGFTPLTALPVQRAAVVGLTDLDGDGDADLLAARSGTLVVFANEAARFREVHAIPWPTYGAATLIADLDGDGDPDLLFLGRRPNTIVWNFGLRDLRVAPQPILGLPFDPTCATVTDLFADGVPDLLLGSDMQAILATAIGGGDGTFRIEPAGISHPTHPLTCIGAGDFDADGHPDALLGFGLPSAYWSAGTDLARNHGGAALRPQRRPVLPIALHLHTDAPQACAGDFNGDGDLDLLVTDDAQRVFLGDGRGGFPSSIALDTPQPGTPHGGDLDGDGDLDAVVVGTTSIRTLWNRGNGRFWPGPAQPIPLAADEFVLCGRLADFDSDGHLDLLVMRRIVGPPGGWPTHDVLFAGDGRGGFAAGRVLASMVSDWDPLAVDIDGDGDVDVVASTAVYLNDGAAVLRGHGIAGGWAGYSFDTGDLDGDGDLDIAVAGNCVGMCQDGGPSSVVWQEAPGVFRRQELPTSRVHFNAGVAVVDADGDGDLDVLCGEEVRNYGGINELALNEGNRRFSVANDRLQGGYEHTLGLTRVDLDHDGDEDVLEWITYQGPTPTPGGVIVHVNTTRHLTSPDPVRYGRRMRLHVDGAVAGGLLLAAPNPSRVDTPFGRFGLEPGSMVVLGGVPPSPHRVTFDLSIPDDSGLLGTHVWWQALVVGRDGPRFTNVVRDVIEAR